MAENKGLRLSDSEWTLGTTAAAANLKFQNVGRSKIRVAYTVGAATPPPGYIGDEYEMRLGEALQAIGDLTTVASADRAWFLALGADGMVDVEWT